MHDFEQLFRRWEVASACLCAYADRDSFVAPEVRQFLIAQLQSRVDQLLAQMWLCVHEERRSLPLL